MQAIDSMDVEEPVQKQKQKQNADGQTTSEGGDTHPQSTAESSTELTELQQKFVDLDDEIRLLMKGTHPEFVRQCDLLNAIREERLKSAERYFELQLRNIQSLLDGEKKQAEDDYENEVIQLRERMMNGLVEKQKRLDDESGEVPISEELLERNTRRLRSRTLTREDPIAGMSGAQLYEAYTKKKRPPILNVNYSLKDDEITDDISIILSSSKGASKTRAHSR